MIKLARVSTESIEKILQEAQQFADGKISKIDGDVFAANLFFENSTRTKTSFEVAEKKLQALAEGARIARERYR